MRFHRVELENACQHEHLELEFSDGLNGIFGPNGSGKSNVLKMMRAAVLGDYRTNAGVKGDNVRQTAGDDERARIVTHVSHGDAEMEIVRGLQKARSQIRVNGGEPVIGDSKVNAEIMRVLGVDQRILGDYVFVMQGDIFQGIVDDKDANRSRSLQALFNTGWAETCWDAVGQRANAIEIPDVAVALDDLRGDVAELEQEVADRQADLAEYDDLNGYSAATDPHRKVLERNKRRGQLRRDVEDLEQQLDDAVESSQSFREEVAALRKHRDGLAASLETLDGSDDVAAKLQRWTTYNRVRKAIQRRQQELRELEAEREANPEPSQPLSYDPNKAELRQQLADMRAELRAATTFVTQFREGDTVECPTCGQVTDELADAVAEREDRIPVLETRIQEFEDVLAVTTDHDDAMREWREWRSDFTARWDAANRDDLQDLADPPAEDEQELRDRQTQRHDAENALTDAERELSGAKEDFAQEQGRISELESQIASKQQQRDAIRITREEFEAAKEAVADTDARLQQRTDIDASLRASRQQLERTRQTLRRTEEQADAAERQRAWHNYLSTIRGALHRDALPRLVAQTYLEVLRDDINDLLDMFDARFYVDVEDGLSFQAHFTGGAVQPVARLSGGQKVLFGVGFRVAVNALFARDVGLLCLDEPTEYLDEHNVGCLTLALNHLKSLSESEGMQFIVITHERTLEPLFDQVIRLQAAN